MDRRLALSEKLHELRGDNVYYQPPMTKKMKYPCIRYTFEGFATIHADDGRYMLKEHYQIMDMYLNPDAHLRREILSSFDYVKFDRTYTADDLHHDVYDVYL